MFRPLLKSRRDLKLKSNYNETHRSFYVSVVGVVHPVSEENFLPRSVVDECLGPSCLPSTLPLVVVLNIWLSSPPLPALQDDFSSRQKSQCGFFIGEVLVHVSIVYEK